MRDIWECEGCGEEIHERDSERHESWHYNAIIASGDGHNGHYLSEMFLHDAAYIVRNHTPERTGTGEEFATYSAALAKSDEWEALADAYNVVNNIHTTWAWSNLSDTVLHDLLVARSFTQSDAEGSVSEWCFEAVQEAEMSLWDLGFNSHWDDGYCIEDHRNDPWTPTTIDGPLRGEYVTIDYSPGVAFYVDEDRGEEIVAHMVGDDRPMTFPVSYATPISPDRFCTECGQTGCSWHAYPDHD